jgi:hypothetical protein
MKCANLDAWDISCFILNFQNLVTFITFSLFAASWIFFKHFEFSTRETASTDFSLINSNRDLEHH